MGPIINDVLNDNTRMSSSPHGYSEAVAHRAVPTPSANGDHTDIARGMGATPVNPQTVTSAVGRGPIPSKIGEFVHPFVDKTSDGQRVNGHRGTKRVPVYDDQGNLTGIRRVVISGT